MTVDQGHLARIVELICRPVIEVGTGSNPMAIVVSGIPSKPVHARNHGGVYQCSDRLPKAVVDHQLRRRCRLKLESDDRFRIEGIGVVLKQSRRIRPLIDPKDCCGL